MKHLRPTAAVLCAASSLCAPLCARADDGTTLVITTEDGTPPPELVVDVVDARTTTAPSAVTSDDELTSARYRRRGTIPSRGLSLGLSMLLGTRPAGDGIEATWFGGFDIGLSLDPVISFGLRRARVGIFGDTRYVTIGASPYVEAALRATDHVALYAQAGAAVELAVRTADVGTDGVGVAPFVGAGLRFHIIDELSIAIEAAAHVPLSNAISIGNVLAPTHSIVLAGGAAVAWHIDS